MTSSGPGAARIVCLGDLMIDVVARLPHDLVPGSDTPAPVELLGGGSAANTAAWLAGQGCRTVFVGRVGDDLAGRAATDALQAGGVELAVGTDPSLPTGTCIVLVGADGERTMVPSAGANAAAPDLPALGSADRLHVSGYALFHDAVRPVVLAMLSSARGSGLAVSVDAASAAPIERFGAERFLDSVGRCLLFANLDEAEVLTGLRDAPAAVTRLARRCGEAIVKRGADGAVWSDGSVTLAVPVEDVVTGARDSTGAGDAFAAGVLAARHQGAAIDAQLRTGIRLAARALTLRGGRPDGPSVVDLAQRV